MTLIPRVVRGAEVAGSPFKEGIQVFELFNDPAFPMLSIAPVRVACGVTTALHTLDLVEFQLVTSGQGLFELGGAQHRVGVGDLIVIPEGVSQRVTNDGAKPLEIVCICAPSFNEQRYHHLSDPSGVHSLPRAQP